MSVYYVDILSFKLIIEAMNIKVDYIRKLDKRKWLFLKIKALTLKLEIEYIHVDDRTYKFLFFYFKITDKMSLGQCVNV